MIRHNWPGFGIKEIQYLEEVRQDSRVSGFLRFRIAGGESTKLDARLLAHKEMEGLQSTDLGGNSDYSCSYNHNQCGGWIGCWIRGWWLHPLSGLILAVSILATSKASFFYGPLKYVTQFLSILLANSAKYPNARFCTKFHSKFSFLTWNTPTIATTH